MTNEPYLATTDEDKDIVTAMHRLCFDLTEMPGLQVALDDKRYFIILVRDDEDGWPTGYVVCRIQDKESRGMWLGVRSEHRGEGWGRILHSAALDEARIRGAETYDLYVAEDNTTAIHLYKSSGFVNVDTHAGFYAHIRGRADDAIIMRKSLIKKEIQESESDENEPYLVTTKRHMSAVMELHALCFNSDEQKKITYALLDKSHFSLLIDDEEPVGYSVVRIQGKEAKGLWSGIRPERRGEGLYRKLMSATINECRVRGAEIWDSYIAEDNETSVRTLQTHKNLGFTLVRSFIDTYINDDGEEIEFANHHFRMSLTERGDYNE